MRSFNYSDGMVGLVETAHPTYGRIEHAWTKGEFEQEFALDLSPWDKVIYEPDLGTYVVVDTNSPVVQTFSSHTEHPALNFIHNKWNVGLEKAIIAHIRQHNDPYYELPLEDAKTKMTQVATKAAQDYAWENFCLWDNVILLGIFLEPAVTTEEKQQIAGWIRWLREVRKGLYQIVNQIKAATTVDDLRNISLDFTQFDTDLPTVGREAIISNR